jgi:DNA-binding response OmpR family regulator
VLLIEDEPALARGLSDTLRVRGFAVEVASDGERGLEAALTGRADLILLDIMLPKVNGYEICRAVREQGIEAPILMLTAKGQEQDVVLGVNLGADDYITKPFRVDELVARARAFLHRRGTSPTVVRFGDCELNLRARTVRRGGMDVELTAKEYALLASIIRPDFDERVRVPPLERLENALHLDEPVKVKRGVGMVSDDGRASDRHQQRCATCSLHRSCSLSGASLVNRDYRSVTATDVHVSEPRWLRIEAIRGVVGCDRELARRAECHTDEPATGDEELGFAVEILQPVEPAAPGEGIYHVQLSSLG